MVLFFFNDTATTEIYTLSLQTLFRSCASSIATHSSSSLVVAITATLFTQDFRSEEHTSELQSQSNLVCRLLLEKKNQQGTIIVALRFRGSTVSVALAVAQVVVTSPAS